MKDYSSLVYLATHNSINVPKQLQKYIPHYELLTSLTKNGIQGTSLFKDIPEEKLLSLYNQGKKSNPGNNSTPIIISRIIYDRLEEDKSLELDERLRLLGILSRYSEGKSSLIEYEETTFSITEEQEELVYLPFGFQPLDELIGGFVPQNLITIAAATGHGKTSFLLSLVNSIQRTHPDKRIVWVSLEMPSANVRLRAKHLSLGDNPNKIITGITSLDQIEEYSNPDTIIVIDYLDLLIQTNSEGLRVALSNAYAKLLSLSTKAFLVFNNTQINRSSSDIFLTSLSESSAKGFYSSYVLGLIKKGSSLTNKGYNNVELKVLKNRYGKSDVTAYFDFNYETLDYTDSYNISGIQYDMETSILLED